MGGSGDTQKTNTSRPQIPKWLRPMLVGTANQYSAAEGALPSISALYGQTPQLQIPNLTPEELASISQFEAIGKDPGQLTDLEKQAAAQYGSFMSENGPSAATKAALKEFSDLQAPQILSQASLMGQGTSGAGLAALAQGQEQALVPFLQQDEQNKFAAAQSAAQLGGTQAERQRSDIANALEAAGMPRDIATQQAKALFDQLEQQWKYAQGIQTAPFNLFGNVIGGGTTTSVSTPSKM